MKLFFQMVFLVVLSSIGIAQVNVETMRNASADSGFAGNVKLAVIFREGNSSALRLKPQFRTDYRSGQNHLFLTGRYEKGKSRGVLNVEKGFLHLRYAHRMTHTLSVEGFLQKEFDKFIRLKDRSLGGAGLRYDFMRESGLVFVAGLSLMYELEKMDNYAGRSIGLVRTSSYIYVNLQINKLIELETTTYWQASLKSSSDFRILSESGIAVLLGNGINLTIDLVYRFDNEPLADIRKYDMEIVNGISLEF